MATSQNTASQDFIPIKDIRDGVVVLKNGQMCAVLLASSINFALKSTDEQEAILMQFQAFLNTLDFSIQMYVQSRRLDIRPYLELLASREGEQYNDLMRVQLREYIEFIRTFTSEVEIMTKSFFVIVPYTPVNTDVKANIKSIIKRGNAEAALDPMRFAEYRTQLEQRVTVVEQGLGRLGIKTIPLGTEELTELYYHFFNPQETSNAPKR
jgi:type IV secretory pathway VirB4 component